jgi:hypothetical protein
MRTTIVLLAIAALAVAILGACRPRDDDGTADSAAVDTARAVDSGASRDSLVTESASVSASAAPRSPARSALPIHRAGDPVSDSPLPPDDSIRAMRPDMPQVTQPKRPRTWRGLKLPEAMPVRAPVETIKRVEQVPDSMMKGDSTKPPTPDR